MATKHILNSYGKTTKAPESRLYSTANPPSISNLKHICSRSTLAQDYPFALRVERNIPIYNTQCLDVNDGSLQDEFYNILLHGPGVFVLQNMIGSSSILENANEAFKSIIVREKTHLKGDHFSAGGSDRIWNSFSKHCQEDPSSFVEYYSNLWLARVCEAWLGPAYRVTAQANIVKPGATAQFSHRDYHLGFQTETSCSRFPRAIQVASQFLTLQGAIAHTDMPLLSGPTRFLPFSQAFEEGFMAYRLPEFADFFSENYVSLPLKRGDAVFFNPALFHAAGSNETKSFERSANLIQASSAFGKAMESIDSVSLVKNCWREVMNKFQAEGWSHSMAALIAALGDGYPFPTNLDRRPPAPGGMAPNTEQDVLRTALEESWTTKDVAESLRQMKQDSAP